MITAIILVIFLIYVFIGLSLTKALFAPEKYVEWSEDEGREVTFPSSHHTLQGRVFNEEGKKGTIVFAHGMGLSAHYYRPEVLHFVNQDYRVMIFEYRGYGKSEGHFMSFRDAVKDITSAVEYFASQDSPLLLIGHSMGGYGVFSALDHIAPKAVIAYAPFRSPFSAMNVCAKRMGIVGRLAEIFLFPIQYLLHGTTADSSIIETINRSKTPMLILQGSNDKEVSIENCSVLKKKDRIHSEFLTVRIVESDESNGHVTIVRKKGENTINSETMAIVDEWIDHIM